MKTPYAESYNNNITSPIYGGGAGNFVESLQEWGRVFKIYSKDLDELFNHRHKCLPGEFINFMYERVSPYAAYLESQRK